MNSQSLKLGEGTPCEVEPKRLSKDIDKIMKIQSEAEYVIEMIACELFGYPAKAFEESIGLAGITDGVEQILVMAEQNLKRLYLIKERL